MDGPVGTLRAKRLLFFRIEQDVSSDDDRITQFAPVADGESPFEHSGFAIKGRKADLSLLLSVCVADIDDCTCVLHTDEIRKAGIN